jgi:hypothetical protein
MASKYMSSGTASFVFSTRTITGATMSTGFAASDVGKVVGFRIGTGIHLSQVDSAPSATSVTLAQNASLPSSNGTIAELILFDQGETHNYQSYLNEIDALIQDDLAKVTLADVKKMLSAAVTQYGKDRGQYVKKTVVGNGTTDYSVQTVFGSLWIHGFTQIREIEHPTDNKPRTILRNDSWEMFDDGTQQDGTNIKLRFIDITPATTESFIAELLLQLSLPEVGSQNFPDTSENFKNITSLAAAYNCFALAAAYAPSSDATIGADSVNYHDKMRKYTDLAREYMRRYSLSVFGSEEPSSQSVAAYVDVDLDTELSGGRGEYIFHPRRGFAG